MASPRRQQHQQDPICLQEHEERTPFLIINFFLIALKLSQEFVIDRLSYVNTDSFPSRSPKSLGGQENLRLFRFNEPPPMTVILVVLRTRWRWPNDEITPTRNAYSVFTFKPHLRRNVSRGGLDHNERYMCYVLALCQDASRIVEAFDVIDSFKIELKRSRCNYTPLTAPHIFLGNLMGISRYPTGLPNTDGSLLPEARQACLARSLSDGSRL
ncbi:hypothetical protein ALC53_13772 [Atta colombica]|uniref:Uncharacterized protein n=1 Tax=Atta colombica TaxID=520822 RepID=A0A195AUQ6_9HYME|nr:hypothetical protein ALC53_13772 [Atta colombica]